MEAFTHMHMTELEGRKHLDLLLPPALALTSSSRWVVTLPCIHPFKAPLSPGAQVRWCALLSLVSYPLTILHFINFSSPQPSCPIKIKFGLAPLFRLHARPK